MQYFAGYHEGETGVPARGLRPFLLGLFSYAALYISFATVAGRSICIGLPFRKIYVPLTGWSVLCLYCVFYALLFKTDLASNLRKMVILGVVISLSFPLLLLNIQIHDASYLANIYCLYIKGVTILSLAAIYFGAYLLRKDPFFMPLIMASLHLSILYMSSGLFGYIAIAAAIFCFCIVIVRSNRFSGMLRDMISPLFRDERWTLATLFLIGTAVRMVFAIHILKVTGGGATFVDASDDGMTYNFNALAMVTNPGDILHGGRIFPGIWDPGYMFFLALIYLFAGHNFYAVTFVQSLLGGALAILCYYIAKRLFNSRAVSVLTSLLVSISVILIMYTIVLGGEALIIPLLALVVLLYLRCFQKPENVRSRIIAGAALGLLVITRSLFIALPVFVFLAELFAVNGIGLRKKIRNSLITVLIAFLFIAPVTFINYMNDGKFSLVVKSNTRLISCWAAVSPWPDISPDNRELIKLGVEPFKDMAGSLRAVQRAPGAVIGTACRIYFKRFINYFVWPCFGFFDPVILVNNSRVDNVFASSMEFYVYLTFLAGLFLTLKEMRKRREILLIFAVILYAMLAHSAVITIVTIRYRTPIVPYLVMISAVGLYGIVCFSREGFSAKSQSTRMPE